MTDLGIAGRIADKLLDSPLVPLIVIAALVLGAWGLIVTPREDRPEIEIPSVAVFVPCPGCGAERVDELVARRLSTLVRQLPDVTDVRSAASADAAVVTIEFAEGLADTEAYSQVRERLLRNAGEFPPEAGAPVIETIGEDRLVILLLTLSLAEEQGADPARLRPLAEELAGRLETANGVRSVELFGGRQRTLQVLPDPQRLAAHGISVATLTDAVAAAAVRLPADALYGNEVKEISAGLTLRSAADLSRIPLGSGPAGPVYLEDVARVADGPAADEQAVLYWQRGHDGEWPAVTLAVTAVPGQNVSEITERVQAQAKDLAAGLVPSGFRLSAGYDAGREATQRVYSVLNQLLTGTLVVVGIIWLGLGWRAAVVIALMMPASLAIVPYAYYQLGFTLNPVSIAAMILAIGILADDAIIMLENIARVFRKRGERSRELTIEAVDEVGNPTILADLLIVATLLPTAYITGEMGQYTRAIPVGASIAVLFSLLIALSITPYFGYRLLRPAGGARAPAGVSGGVAEEEDGGRFARAYRRLLTPFLDHAGLRWLLYAVMLALLAGALALVATRHVQVGLTPLLDRELFLVEIESPRGTPLTQSLAAADATARELRRIPEVEAYTIYAGLKGPMVLPPPEAPAVARQKPETVSVFVELVPEAARDRLSYVVSRGLAARLDEALAPWSARAYVRRIPSGPSSDRAVEAEIYARDGQSRMALADGVADVLAGTRGVIAVQQTPRDAAPALIVEVDQARAAARGVIPGEAARIVRIALAGATPASAHVTDSRRPVPITVRLAREERRETEDLAALYVDGADGSQVPLLDVVTTRVDDDHRVRHRRNARPVIYVGADLDRSVAEPLTVQHLASGPISRLPASPAVDWFSQPPAGQAAAVYWGGEWETTLQVYTDLGVAGAIVMILVYVLMAGWFQSYGVPLLIMMPIPLIFIGVIPAHWLWGIDIAGTGVMGMIALIGIVARNAVLLVDFVREREAEQMDVREAVIRAGALRTRPILLTAATVMFGSGVLIFEPALEPLGLTLAAGVLVSTLLTLVLIPVLYHHCYGGNDTDSGRR